MTDQALVELAFTMLDRAYVPYSRFPVGAALLCAGGTVFTGCNVENAAFGSTICAERTALVKAVSEGHRKFTRIAVAAATERFTAPCGVCRQVMMEFCDPDRFQIILATGTDHYDIFTLRELLPQGFGPGNLA